jgi:hypothetical protein
MLNLVACRRALVERQVDGDLDSMESLAKSVGISRSTASRFFSGRPTSLAVTLLVLETLHVKFEDVARPVNEDDDDDSAGAVARSAPRRPDGGIGGPLSRVV